MKKEEKRTTLEAQESKALLFRVHYETFSTRAFSSETLHVIYNANKHTTYRIEFTSMRNS